MKKQVLQAIYKIYEQWVTAQSDTLQPKCTPRCATCCTQNVTITAMEGENILQYILKNDMVDGFAAALAKALKTRAGYASPQCTTNDLAQACFNGEEVEIRDETQEEMCPFLEEDLCSIYPARPFGCRLFLSSARCSSNQPALIPDFYVDAAAATNQIIEHLGQKEYWGNMLDVLASLLDIREFAPIATQVEQYEAGLTRQARMRVLAAKPLPGFLITEENQKKITPLLESFFHHKIEKKPVEDILNGY